MIKKIIIIMIKKPATKVAGFFILLESIK